MRSLTNAEWLVSCVRHLIKRLMLLENNKAADAVDLEINNTAAPYDWKVDRGLSSDVARSAAICGVRTQKIESYDKKQSSSILNIYFDAWYTYVVLVKTSMLKNATWGDGNNDKRLNGRSSISEALRPSALILFRGSTIFCDDLIDRKSTHPPLGTLGRDTSTTVITSCVKHTHDYRSQLLVIDH